MVPHDPNALLTRERAASALTALGYTISPKTLAGMATRGGGPPYVRFGRRALYRWADVLDWARAKTSPPSRSTSEADARRSANHP